MVLAGGLGSGAFLNIHLVRHAGIDRMITGSLSVMLAAAAAVLLLGIGWTNLWTLTPPIFVFETGLACLFANAHTGALAPFPKLAGIAGALYGALQVFGAFAALFARSSVQIQRRRRVAWQTKRNAIWV